MFSHHSNDTTTDQSKTEWKRSIPLRIFLISSIYVLAKCEYNNGDSSLATSKSNPSQKSRQNIKRLAILSPFATNTIHKLPLMFEQWQAFSPCGGGHSILDNKSQKHQKEHHGKIRRSHSHYNDRDKFNHHDHAIHQHHKTNHDDLPLVQVDIILSYSQHLNDSSSQLAKHHFETIIHNFNAAKDILNKNNTTTNTANTTNTTTETTTSSSWEQCIHDIKVIECGIDPNIDLYSPDQSRTNRMWVHGPNQQFITSMEKIMNDDLGQQHSPYDAVFVMEADVVPVQHDWLDTLIDEAEESPFVILGSKYDGDSWDSFRSSLSLALQHHINGNAIYNTTHPLFQHLLAQLQIEVDTPYHAIPYDYRISQILVEGMLGIRPDIPPRIIDEWSRENGGRQIETFTDTFKAWWNEYGRGVDNRNGEKKEKKSSSHQQHSVIRESHVIANYAGTNLLPRMKDRKGASLIHGARYYAGWDRARDNITLVISDWQEELAMNLLSEMDTSDHPFSNVVLMLPTNVARQSIKRFTNININSIAHRLQVQKRASMDDDYTMDICKAVITTEWFMMTNSYHVLSPRIDLMFTNDNKHQPVIPFLNADNDYCRKDPSCIKANEESKQFDQRNNMVVEDSDMIFNTVMRDEFCSVWRSQHRYDGTNGDKKKKKKPSSNTDDVVEGRTVDVTGPSATAYVSYLSKQGLLHEVYSFTESIIFGKRKHFHRIISEEKERGGATHGETALASHVLKDEMAETMLLIKRKKKGMASPLLVRGLDEFVPSFTPPAAPQPTSVPQQATSLPPTSPTSSSTSSPSNETLDLTMIPSLSPSSISSTILPSNERNGTSFPSPSPTLQNNFTLGPSDVNGTLAPSFSPSFLTNGTNTTFVPSFSPRRQTNLTLEPSYEAFFPSLSPLSNTTIVPSIENSETSAPSLSPTEKNFTFIPSNETLSPSSDSSIVPSNEINTTFIPSLSPTQQMNFTLAPSNIIAPSLSLSPSAIVNGTNATSVPTLSSSRYNGTSSPSVSPTYILSMINPVIPTSKPTKTMPPSKLRSTSQPSHNTSAVPPTVSTSKPTLVSNSDASLAPSLRPSWMSTDTANPVVAGSSSTPIIPPIVNPTTSPSSSYPSIQSSTSFTNTPTYQQSVKSSRSPTSYPSIRSSSPRTNVPTLIPGQKNNDEKFPTAEPSAITYDTEKTSTPSTNPTPPSTNSLVFYLDDDVRPTPSPSFVVNMPASVNSDTVSAAPTIKINEPNPSIISDLTAAPTNDLSSSQKFAAAPTSKPSRAPDGIIGAPTIPNNNTETPQPTSSAFLQCRYGTASFILIITSWILLPL